MTTYTEQLFLFGEVDAEATLPDPITTLIAYSDLTAGSALIFAVVVLLSFAIAHWAALISLVSSGARRLVISPARAVWSLLGWGLLQLCSKEARLDTRQVLFPALVERFITFIYQCRMYRLAAAVYDWYLPTNRPLAVMLRLFGTYCSGLVVWTKLMAPASSYLAGLFDVWTAEGRYVYCPRAISTYYRDDWLTRAELSDAMYFFGGQAGVALDTLATDAWETLAHSSDDGEINHFYAFAIISCVISLAIVALALCTLVPRSSSFQRVKLILAQLGDSNDSGSTPIQTESNLWSMTNQYELDLAEKDAQLANKSALLTAVSAELQVSKKQREENWALVGALRDRRNQARDAHQLEQALSSQLRLQLDTASRRLKAVEVTMLGDREDLALARQELKDQRKQLSDEREGLDRWRQQLSAGQELVSGHETVVAEKQQLVDGHRSLAAEKCRLEGENQKLAEECQRFARERQQMVDEYHLLVSEYQKTLVEKQGLFVRESQELISRNGQLSMALESAQQERNDSFAQAMQLRQEMEAATMAANASYVDSQESLARTQHAEKTLQQFMADLKLACDQSLAHERAVARQACREADDLSGETGILQMKIGLAIRDAERAQVRATEAEGTIKVLNHRLARHEAVERGGTQDIPKRQTGNVKSMATALSEQEVRVAAQMAEIANLKGQLDKMKRDGPAPQPADGAAKATLERMRAALEKERREKKEDSVRWGAKARELEESNQKLRIALSNAEARGGGVRASPNTTPLRPARQ